MACVAAGCSDVTGAKDDGPVTRLSLRANGLPELTGREFTVAADDSLIIRATVEGNPDAYGTPVLSASIPAALTLRGDGTAAVRYAAPLVLTATAAAKSPSSRTPTLYAGATLNVACTMEARPGLSLTLQDSATGLAPSGAGGMRLRATNGTYSDSLVVPLSLGGSWSMAWERRGTFTVTIDADGYLPWRRDDIVVTGGLCHVYATRVTARLQRK